MKFCIKCENMYYIQIDSDDKNKLSYYCRNCGYKDNTITNEGVCVLDTQIQKLSKDLITLLMNILSLILLTTYI